MSVKSLRTFAYYHTPPEAFRCIFHCVLRAGHHRIQPGFNLQTWRYPGHELILVHSGVAAVQIASRVFSVQSGELIWIDCNHNEIRWMARSQPLEIFWIRIDSEQANANAEFLGVALDPIFRVRNLARLRASFRKILGLLRTRPVSMDATIHATIAALLAVLFEARQSDVASGNNYSRAFGFMPEVGEVLKVVRKELKRHWKVGEMAEIAGMSVPTFFRRFSQATGSSPGNWVRRERISVAKRRLATTGEPISKIAEAVGYIDAHYFSRDFKKLVGMSPKVYREMEQVNVVMNEFVRG